MFSFSDQSISYQRLVQRGTPPSSDSHDFLLKKKKSLEGPGFERFFPNYYSVFFAFLLCMESTVLIIYNYIIEENSVNPSPFRV